MFPRDVFLKKGHVIKSELGTMMHWGSAVSFAAR